MRKLRSFLKGNCDMSDEREAVVFEELLRGARLKSQRDVERFTALYNAFHNTTRMPCNRGYTPDEMMRVMPPKEGFKSLSLGPNIKKYLQTGEMDIEDFRKQILTMDLPSRGNALRPSETACRHQALRFPAGETEESRAQRSLSVRQWKKIQAVLWEMTIPQAG